MGKCLMRVMAVIVLVNTNYSYADDEQTWLRCTGKSTYVATSGESKPILDFETIYLWDATREQIWEYKKEEQKLMNAAFSGFQVTPEKITLEQDQSFVVTIDRISLAYFYEHTAPGGVLTLQGQCRKVAPQKVLSKPVI